MDRTLLVVEWDETYRQLLAHGLGREGYQTDLGELKKSLEGVFSINDFPVC